MTGSSSTPGVASMAGASITGSETGVMSGAGLVLAAPRRPCRRALRLSIGRTLARYPLAGPSPAPPFQTVRARFGHTAYRWSLGVRHAQGQEIGRASWRAGG